MLSANTCVSHYTCTGVHCNVSLLSRYISGISLGHGLCLSIQCASISLSVFVCLSMMMVAALHAQRVRVVPVCLGVCACIGGGRKTLQLVALFACIF